MNIFFAAGAKREIINLVLAASDALCEGDICLLDGVIELIFGKLIFLKEVLLNSFVHDPDSGVHGFFNTVRWHPTATTGIENTKGQNQA
jgi:hypothetical protein